MLWDGIFAYLYKDHSSFAVRNPHSFRNTIPLEVISDVAVAVSFKTTLISQSDHTIETGDPPP
jgi:hypothetical protein